MTQLGQYQTSSSCLYVKRLSDIDLKVLGALVSASVREVKRRYGAVRGPR